MQPANGGAAEPGQPSAAGAPDIPMPVTNGHATAAAADLNRTDSGQPAGAAAPLFPLDGAAAAGASTADALAAGRLQAPLFPSYPEDTGGAAAGARPAEGRASGTAGADRTAVPLPTASSFRLPPGGLFNAGLYSAAPRMPQTVDTAAVPAAEPNGLSGSSTANGTPAAAEAATGGAKAAQPPQQPAAQYTPLPAALLQGRAGTSTDRWRSKLHSALLSLVQPCAVSHLC